MAIDCPHPQDLVTIGNRFRRRRLLLPGNPTTPAAWHNCGVTPEPGMIALFPRTQTIRNAANHTVTVAESGALYIATAAVTYTLPTPAEGLAYAFFQIADAELTLQGAGDIYGVNAANADSASFQTVGQHQGAMAAAIAAEVSAGEWAWLVINLSKNLLTFA
jgi:hypothetical protein